MSCIITANTSHIKFLTHCEHIGRQSLPIYYSISDLRDFITSPDAKVILYINDGESDVIGFAVTTDKPGRIHLMSLAVDPKFRRHGVASKLINYIKQSQQPITLYVQSINSTAIKFYQANQFKITAELDHYYVNLASPKAYFMLFQYNVAKNELD